MRDEAIVAEARDRKAMQPVTWRDVLGLASTPIVYGGIGLALLLTEPRWATWHSWPVLLCFLFALGGASTTIGAYRGMLRGWTKGQVDPFVKVGCWFFIAPVAVSLIVSVGECAKSM